MSFNRRSFFTASGLIAAGTLAAPSIVEGAASRAISPKGRPRNIIHMVSDGMSAGTLTCADYLSELVRKKRSSWLGLYSNPSAVNSLMNMRSLNSLVTDSSAASSSWGSGSRIMNGAVNVLPDGTELTPLYTLFKQRGWKRGLVTTTEITHATPSGFAANDTSRGSAEAIAKQYLEREVDLLLGGGSKFFLKDKREDKHDLFADYAKAGYTVCRTSAELDKAPMDKRLLGIFAESHLPFSVDHARSTSQWRDVPTLAELSQFALKKLSRERNFILQIEGGRVDHACHNCDAAGALYDQIAFDEAIQVALDFQQANPDTLIVITTDHGNGNLGLNGMGDGYEGSSRLFSNLTRFKTSFSKLVSDLEKAKNAAEVRDIISDLTGFKPSMEDSELYLAFIEKKGSALYSSMNSNTAQLGQLLADYTGISFTSGSHTADYVAVTAIGPGSDRFRGFIQNTDVFYHYLALAKIDFRNKSVPLVAMGPTPNEVELTEHYALA